MGEEVDTLMVSCAGDQCLPEDDNYFFQGSRLLSLGVAETI